MNLEECQKYLKDKIKELLSAITLYHNLVDNSSDFNLDLNSFIKNNISILNKEFNKIKSENKLYDIEGNTKLLPKKINIENLEYAYKRIDNLLDNINDFKLAKIVKEQIKDKKFYYKDIFIDVKRKETENPKFFIRICGRYLTYKEIKKAFKNKAVKIENLNSIDNNFSEIVFYIRLHKKKDYTYLINKIENFINKNKIDKKYFGPMDCDEYTIKYKSNLNNLIRDLGLEEFQNKTII